MKWMREIKESWGTAERSEPKLWRLKALDKLGLNKWTDEWRLAFLELLVKAKQNFLKSDFYFLKAEKKYEFSQISKLIKDFSKSEANWSRGSSALLHKMTFFLKSLFLSSVLLKFKTKQNIWWWKQIFFPNWPLQAFSCAHMKAENLRISNLTLFHIWKLPNQSYEPLKTNRDFL